MTTARSGAIWAFVACVATAAAVLEWLVVVPLSHPERQWPLLWPALVSAGFLAAELLVVHLRIGREAYAFSLMEIPLVLGLFFVRPDLLVLCRLLGAAVAFGWERRPPQKAAFNCALFALETVGAVVIWHLVRGGAGPLGPRAWLATGLSVLFTSLVGSALVTVAITISTGERPGSLSELFSLGQLGDLANACFALVAVYVVSTDWRASWLLVVVTAVMVVAYRSFEGVRQRSESLERVNRFTEVVGAELELDPVLRRVLLEVREAFGVRVVQLRVQPAADPPQDWVLHEELPHRGEARLVDVLSPHATDGAALVARHGRVPALAAALAAERVRDAVMVPLRSGGLAIGSLVVADRLGDVASFGKADLHQLRAFANHASVAIDNALRAALIVRQGAEREHEALHDELTGLANRRLFGRRLGEVLEHARAAVLLLDLDQFAEVNHTLGHEIGDRLLRLVADRLRTAAPADAVVARLGGDEFGVLLPGAGDLDARACASSVKAALARPFVLHGLGVAVDACVGVATGASGADAVTVERRADLAKYSAKRTGTGIDMFRPEMDRQDTSRLALLADLRSAVAANELTVSYQPKVDLRTGAVCGAEALARWSHPRLGTIGPDEFIPLAEHSSLVTPLTMVVLRRALRDCARWLECPGHFSLAVNISPRSLLEAGFVDEIADALLEASVTASELTLEITETSLMTDPERAIAALDRLRALGVRLSIDDLGTGYSSLAYLQRLPVDEIKIDRSFVTAFPDPSARAVVGAIVELGHRLGRSVVAEGVEDLETFDALRELGCDLAQGFLLGRPMPVEELAELLAGDRLVDPHPALRRVQ